MKSAVKAVVLLTLSFTLFGALLVQAQTYSNPPFEHVIIVIQENRTPDNLFGAAVAGPSPYLFSLGPGYDLSLPPQQTYPPGGTQQESVPWCFGTCFSPGHTHGDWEAQYNSGGTYHPWKGNVSWESCPNLGTTCNGETTGGSNPQMPTPTYPQETYSSSSLDASSFTSASFPNGASPLVPYFDIANKYGFANYFFQTNQGPSQPAHDFLFGGTSSPVGALKQGDTDTSQYFEFFSGENVNEDTSGCGTGDQAKIYYPNAKDTDSNNKPGYAIKAPPCFERQTLADLLDNAQPQALTWRYYTDLKGNPPSIMGIWDAPAGIQHLCEWNGTTCTTKYFTGQGNPYGIPNVIAPPTVFFADAFSTPGGTNINAPPPPGGGSGPVYCDLPNVTWIIPDGNWSDHPGGAKSTDYEIGPDWVASIINAVGNAKCVDPANNGALWDDTVIFVVWDDWGGFYDHIGNELPFSKGLFPNFSFGSQYTGGLNGGYGQGGGCFFQQVQGGNWGCGYTYGWRVPFLVVSKWTPPGYVSGSCTGGSGGCPLPNLESPTGIPYLHDFGSILAFIENNFSLGIGNINSTANGGTNYPFADAYYLEGQVNGGPYLPLGDFFGLWGNSENSICPDGCPQPFNAIECAVPTGKTSDYCPSHFANYTGPYADPDNDVMDND